MQQVSVSGHVNFTRSQSDDLIVKAMMKCSYLVAHWKLGEPIIDGWGDTPYQAVNLARMADAPHDAELCSRVVGETMVWQSRSGKFVTVEDFLTVDGSAVPIRNERDLILLSR